MPPAAIPSPSRPACAGQTIALTNGPILISQNLNLDASALTNPVTINGMGSSRLFQCNAGATNTFTALKLTGGYALDDGGAILNEGDLTLNQCNVSGNTAGSLGGGLANEAGSSTLNNCTVSGNTAGAGGGLFNSAQVSLNQCTLAENGSALGGGAFNLGALSLYYCTVSGNTVSGGGGGVFNFGTLDLASSIVAGNTALSQPNVRGLINSTNGVNVLSGDPRLNPLGNYGGPTPTMPPLPGSPAIDPLGGETNNFFATDQRGLPRVINLIVDVGATENQAFIVTTANDEDDGDAQPEHGTGTSLREALRYGDPGDTITFDPSLSGATIVLTNSITLTRDVIIDAVALPGGLVIDGNNAHALFHMNYANKNITFNGLTLTGSFGSAINDLNPTSVPGTLTLNQCTLHGNSGAYYGGAIYMNFSGSSTVSDNLFLNRCLLFDNHSTDGGAIYLNSCYGTVLSQCTLSNNSAGDGGAILCDNGGKITFNECTLNGNTALRGGAVGVIGNNVISFRPDPQ